MCAAAENAKPQPQRFGRTGDELFVRSGRAAFDQLSDFGLTIEGAFASASGVWMANAGVVPFARTLRFRSLPMFLRRR